MAAIAYKYKSVMLVDDNEIDNLINQKMIEATNFAEHVYTFSGAISALDFLKNIRGSKGISSEHIPDIIFLDINMPILDGFQFLEEFEKLSEEIRTHTRILMLSSSISPKDIDRAASSRYVYKYINKPLNARYLEAINL